MCVVAVFVVVVQRTSVSCLLLMWFCVRSISMLFAVDVGSVAADLVAKCNERMAKRNKFDLCAYTERHNLYKYVKLWTCMHTCNVYMHIDI